MGCGDELRINEAGNAEFLGNLNPLCLGFEQYAERQYVVVAEHCIDGGVYIAYAWHTYAVIRPPHTS